MNGPLPLGKRVATDLTTSQSVTLTAIGLGVAAFVVLATGGSGFVGAKFPAPFLLSMSLMNVAFVYNDFWPQISGPAKAVVWTVVYGVGTVAIFVGVFVFISSDITDWSASTGAFVTTAGVQIGGAILYARSR